MNPSKGLLGKISLYSAILLAFVLILIFNSSFVFAGTHGTSVANDNSSVYQCGSINTSGTYAMNQSLNGIAVIPPDASGCIQITSDNIVLDCAGYYIRNISLASPAIYANGQTNITIKNCNITMNGTSGAGVTLGISNSLVINNTIRSNTRGIWLTSGSGNNITNNTISNSSYLGIDTSSVSSNIITNNIMTLNNWGIEFSSLSYNNTFANNTLTYGSSGIIISTSSYNNTVAYNNISFISGEGVRIGYGFMNTILGNNLLSDSYGIYISSDIGGNSIINNNIWNSTDGLYLETANNDTISGGSINVSSGYAVHILSATNNTVIKDMWLNNSGQNDTFFDGNSLNNTLINVTYNRSKEQVISGSQLTRKWYIFASVDNQDGDGYYVQNVNLSDSNSTTLFWSQLITNPILFSSTEYTNYGNTIVNSSVHNINVSKSGFVSNSTTVNLTENQPYTNYIYMSIRDIQAPIVNLSSPSSGTTYTSGSYNVSFIFNVTEDSQVANCSVYVDGANYTNTTAILKSYNNTINASKSLGVANTTYTYWAYVNCTDAAGNTGNSSTITFTLTKPVPNASTYINNVPSNQTVTYPSSATIKGNTTISSPPLYSMYVGGSLLGSGVPPFSSSVIRGVGTYGVSYQSSGNGDWSPFTNNTLYLIVIQNATNPVGLTISNGTSYNDQNLTILNGTTITVNCSLSYADSGSCYLYRDENLTVNSTNETVTVNGNYTYKANATGNANYSSNSLGETFYLTVFTLDDNSSCASSGQCTNGYCVHGICRNASTYCGDSFCDTGESCTSDNSGCSSGYACTNGCASTGGGNQGVGGGGSGGGGGSAPTNDVKVTTSKGHVNISIPFIRGILNVSIPKTEDVTFRQINITAANNMSSIKVMISKISFLPISASSGISSLAYHNILIEKVNFTDSNLSMVSIKFAVNMSWMASNQIALTNISLYRWSSESWSELATRYVSNTSLEVFYVAESPGFSYFMIGTKGGIILSMPPKAAKLPVQCAENWSCTDWSDCNGHQTRTCTDANACGTDNERPQETQACAIEQITEQGNNWAFPTLGVVIVSIFALLFVLSRKNTFKVSKKSKK